MRWGGKLRAPATRSIFVPQGAFPTSREQEHKKNTSRRGTGSAFFLASHGFRRHYAMRDLEPQTKPDRHREAERVRLRLRRLETTIADETIAVRRALEADSHFAIAGHRPVQADHE